MKNEIARQVVELKRERILAKAAELFFARGYLGTSMDAISEGLSVTKPFIYYHFNSKIDLLTEICQRGTKEALRVAEDAISSSGSATERLERFVQDFTLAALENQQYVMIYFREEINLDQDARKLINDMRKKINHDVKKLLLEGKKAKEFVFDDANVCALAITGMASYAFAWYRKEGLLSKEHIAKSISELVLRMLKTTSESKEALDKVS